jgi:DNA-directed RNA polymerase specialized sigma24 family protein/predicted Ser/Thr protein kinase
MSDKDLHSRELLALVEARDDQAAVAVFDRYVERLLAMVRERIGRKLRRRIDADDVVQSTYRSFFVHAGQGKYHLAEAGDLWRLLASIAIHKLYGQVEKHTAARRGIAREEAADDSNADRIETPEPTAAEVVAITEQLQLISKRLTADQQSALIAHLQGDSAATIATKLQKSPRTIRRLLAEARDAFEMQLVADAKGRHRIDEQTRREFDARASLAYADYTLERLVGAGGMGKVYRATQRTTGQQVAIKTLLKSRQHDRRVVEKFLEEAEILAHLNHPNIVKLHGVGRFPGGGYFLAMDFIDGTDLQSRLSQSPLSVVEAVAVVRSVATAIAHVHLQNIVHGDVKPANILVDSANRVIVTDFGLSQFVDVAPTRQSWLVGGTAGYVAPEILNGLSRPTAAADIYALGALLVALITGSPRTAPESLGKSQLTGSLASICGNCLAADAQERFQSIKAFIKALDEAR